MARLLMLIENLARFVRSLQRETAGRRRLSPIQLNVLLAVCRRRPGRSRVGSLARQFGVSDATMSVVVAALCRKKLLLRGTQASDRRVSALRPTAAGRRLAKRLAEWDLPLRKQFAHLPSGTISQMAESLLLLLRAAQRAGLIGGMHICYDCKNFEENADPGSTRAHRCGLTGETFGEKDFRVDCPEHEPSTSMGGRQ